MRKQDYRAFQNTTVPLMKSLGDISGLVISHSGGCSQSQTEDGFAVELSFATTSKKSNVYRFVQVVSPDFLNQYRQEHPKHRRDIEELKRQELARRARAVYYYLKGLFEIVDLGYAVLGELLVGQLVLPGRKETLYQRYGQGLESGELGLPVNTTPLALTAKITSELEIEDAEYEEVEEK